MMHIAAATVSIPGSNASKILVSTESKQIVFGVGSWAVKAAAVKDLCYYRKVGQQDCHPWMKRHSRHFFALDNISVVFALIYSVRGRPHLLPEESQQQSTRDDPAGSHAHQHRCKGHP